MLPSRNTTFAAVLWSQIVLALCVPMLVGVGMFVTGGCELAAQPCLKTSGVPTDETRAVEPTQDNATTQQIELLIEHLGSSSYAVRQSSAEQLWGLGNQAKLALQRAAAQGDSEVARRANEILAVLAMH